MAKDAYAAWLKMLGISDHGPKTLGGGRISYFRSLAFAQPKRLGVRMLYGAEVNILDQEGKLDLDDEISLVDLDADLDLNEEIDLENTEETAGESDAAEEVSEKADTTEE